MSEEMTMRKRRWITRLVGDSDVDSTPWRTFLVTEPGQLAPQPIPGRAGLLRQLGDSLTACPAPTVDVPAVLLGFVHLPRLWSGVPAPENAAIIIGGILLLGGALLVAWAEKSLYSEHAYQYSTMQMLFNSSQLRMERALAELEKKNAGDPEYRRLLGEIQDFLYALGREALDENAEWLILHRSRPLEPVMAG